MSFSEIMGSNSDILPRFSDKPYSLAEIGLGRLRITEGENSRGMVVYQVIARYRQELYILRGGQRHQLAAGFSGLHTEAEKCAALCAGKAQPVTDRKIFEFLQCRAALFFIQPSEPLYIAVDAAV